MAIVDEADGDALPLPVINHCTSRIAAAEFPSVSGVSPKAAKRLPVVVVPPAASTVEDALFAFTIGSTRSEAAPNGATVDPPVDAGM